MFPEPHKLQHYNFWYITNETGLSDREYKRCLGTVQIQRLVKGINRDRFLCLFVGLFHDQYELGVQNRPVSFMWEAGMPRC